MGGPRTTYFENTKIGRLTVIEYTSNFSYVCKCDCGNTVIVRAGNLKNGHTKSCGCITRENPPNTRHGHSESRLYNIHQHMIRRCNNAKDSNYPYYGARGIEVCQEWSGNQGFQNFYNWAMSNGYDETLTIDRIDVDGNYEPNNCRWADYKVQQNNRTNNHLISYKGETKTLSEWSEYLNIPSARLEARLRNGWSIERAFNTPKLINQFKEA